MPGGKVEENDSIIRHAIERKVIEETNFTVSRIVSPLSAITYATEKKAKNDLREEIVFQ